MIYYDYNGLQDVQTMKFCLLVIEHHPNGTLYLSLIIIGFSNFVTLESISTPPPSLSLYRHTHKQEGSVGVKSHLQH